MSLFILLHFSPFPPSPGPSVSSSLCLGLCFSPSCVLSPPPASYFLSLPLSFNTSLRDVTQQRSSVLVIQLNLAGGPLGSILYSSVKVCVTASGCADAPGSNSLQNLGCSWILTEDAAAQTISSGVAYLWPLVSDARYGGLYSASSWCPRKELQVDSFLA